MWNIAHNMGGFLAPILAGTAAKVSPPKPQAAATSSGCFPSLPLPGCVPLRHACTPVFRRPRWPARSLACLPPRLHAATPPDPQSPPCPTLRLQMYGWKWGMFAPGLVGTVMGLLILAFVRDSPEASE